MSNEHTQSPDGNSEPPSRFPSNPPSVVSYDTLAHLRTMNLAEGLEEMARLQKDGQIAKAEVLNTMPHSMTNNSLDRGYFNMKKGDGLRSREESFNMPKSVSAPTGNWINSSPTTPIGRMDKQLRMRLMNQSEYSLSNGTPKDSPNLGFFPNASTQSSASSEAGQRNSMGNASAQNSPLMMPYNHSMANLSYGHMPSPLPNLSVSGRQILSSRPAFRSRKLNHQGNLTSSFETGTTDGNSEKPTGESQQLLWTQTKEGKKVGRKAYILFLTGVSIGIIGAAALVVLGLMPSLKKNNYCLVLEDNFNSPQLDTSVWKFERQTGGFGNNEFEWTTDSTNNTYIKDGMLHIVPTLTSDALGVAAVDNGYTLNLTTTGVCTSTDYLQCGVSSNSSTGTILPPIQSARLTTRGTKSIRYGRIEVRAKMPTGDWIWPAIWMMPKDSVYGEWPASGEIDIVESKGNKPKSRSDQLSNVVRSTLHWGPTMDQDAWWRTTGIAKAWRNFFNQEFYTFGLEWDETGLYTWQGSRVRKFMQVKFDETFYERGHFPSYSNNGTQITNPWSESKMPLSAPFDQEFYLIMNVAVGGTNGYFGDDEVGSNGAAKPWSNSGKHAARDFWLAKDKWLPTWPSDPAQRGMIVDYVKMYQKC